MATPVQAAAKSAARSAGAVSPYRIAELQRLLQMGPEALAKRAEITAENLAAKKARAAARADKVAPILEAMRGNSAATAIGGDIPRPRPAADTLPSGRPPARPLENNAYPVDQSRLLALLDRVNAEGMDSLAPDELIVIEDIQSGRAYLSGEAPAPAAVAPLDAPDVMIESPPLEDLNGNLAASATELDEPPKRSGIDNLTPKKAKGPTPLEKLANEINNATGQSSPDEAIAPRQARAIQKKIDALTSDEFAELVSVIGNETDAMRRLEAVQNLAGDAARDPNSLAAQAIDRAAQAREGTMRAPGSNSPEFATDELTDADMPTALDTALAAERERLAALNERSVGGGMSEADRLEAAGVDNMRDAPLAFKGRDGRPTALESRSRGSRAVEGNDIRAIQKELAAQAAGTTAYPQGRAAMAESRLNKGGQQETYDDLVLALAGFRPRAETNIARSNPAMGAAERGAMADEAARVFGEDSVELIPDAGELDGVEELGEGGKPRKVRGRPLPSRRLGAVDQMFGSSNPLAMPEFGGDPLRVADEVLAKNTIFRPGTANYEMAREQIARAISEKFGTAGPRPASDLPAVTSRSPEPTQAGAAAPAADASPASTPVNEQNLEASGVDLGASPALEGPTATKPAKGKGTGKGRGKGKGNKAAEADDMDEMPPLDAETNDLEARARASAERLNKKNGGGKQPPKDPPKNPPDDTSKSPPLEGEGRDAVEIIDDDAASNPTKSTDGGGKQPPNDPPAKKPDGGDTATPSPKGKKGVGKYLWPAVGIGGLVAALNAIGRSSGGGIVNIPAPPGGGAEGGGGGSSPPLPPGASISTEASRPAVPPSDIDRAIERIRNSRGGTGRATQTLQNW